MLISSKRGCRASPAEASAATGCIAYEFFRALRFHANHAKLYGLIRFVCRLIFHGGRMLKIFFAHRCCQHSILYVSSPSWSQRRCRRHASIYSCARPHYMPLLVSGHQERHACKDSALNATLLGSAYASRCFIRAIY